MGKCPEGMVASSTGGCKDATPNSMKKGGRINKSRRASFAAGGRNQRRNQMRPQQRNTQPNQKTHSASMNQSADYQYIYSKLQQIELQCPGTIQSATNIGTTTAGIATFMNKLNMCPSPTAVGLKQEIPGQEVNSFWWGFCCWLGSLLHGTASCCKMVEPEKEEKRRGGIMARGGRTKPIARGRKMARGGRTKPIARGRNKGRRR